LKLLERNILFSLVILASIPFSLAIHINIGVAKISIAEFFEIFILLNAIFLIMHNGISKEHGALLLIFVILIIFYSTLSITFNNATKNETLIQSRFYLPFLTATTLLAVKIRVNIQQSLIKISFGITLSAIIAVICHLFFRDLVVRLISADEQTVYVVETGGRMYWDTSSIVFFVIASFFISKFKNVFATSILIIFLGIILTQSRSLLIAFLLIFVLSFLKTKGSSFRFIIPIIIGATSVLLFFLVADDQMKSLLLTRFGVSDIESEYERAFLINRVLLYQQYISILVDTFPFGQGLGIPLGVNGAGIPVYTTDISMLSFFLPLGVFGLSLFMWFIWVNWSLFSRQKMLKNSFAANIFKLILSVTFLMSFNIDIFSRDIFVIYLVYFASAFKQTYATSDILKTQKI